MVENHDGVVIVGRWEMEVGKERKGLEKWILLLA